ncbi:gastrula zinc finger protein XlCGF26.1 isoform X22 [Plutella xylostella]|uniref:gastrula zinc finger protein XlCGF26.1 isoform X22 n=1 Tax=Plutella xylostella TaxID=51655 RepID=UPI002032A917|nr:gastrula zinc finger protein XlCGF26.1 isoform X22 [Plutella xylostella]
MDVGKSSSWPPGPTVCRCCLAEGCYKDISTEYFWMGKREVYAEMLTETFDLAISYAQSAGTNSNSRLICEPCISRLRDASEFKRQVSECERMFTTLLEPGSSGQSGMAQVTLSRLGKDVKVERVKVKKEDSEDDDDDDMFAEPFGDDDDDDDADDEPLTNLATKIPKKEAEDDIFGSEDKPKPAEKRKATVKAKAVPAKKAKATVTKAKGPAAKVAKPQEKKKRGDSQDAMTTNMRNNAMKIVEYATAYPFRLPELDVMCVLCSRSFEDPKDFRDHFDNDHKVFNIKEAFFHLTRFDRKLKVDFTDVRCRICNQLFDDLDSVANHLKAEHDKEISNDGYALEIFKFEPGKWVCAYCKEKFVSLRSLSRHTACHFRNFVCPTCGKKYTFDRDLDEHIKKKHSNLFACVKCRKTFPSDKDRKEHMEESISCWPNTCMYCKEKFKSDTSRIKHMQQIHGMAARVFKCTACLLEFPSIRVRGYHFVKEHTDKFVCSICGQKFATQKRLQVHIDRHAGLKKFKCDVCSKGFVMKSELVQHYWAHREDKRFECKLCNKKFNQKVTWKGHMKSKHPELVDF